MELQSGVKTGFTAKFTWRQRC